MSEELAAREEHGKWIRWWNDEKRSGPQPPPAYRDCRNCQHASQEAEDRLTTCHPCLYEDATDWESLPPCPPLRWYRILALSRYGPEVCADWYRQGRISEADMRDLTTLREHRQAQMMGAFGG